MKKVAILFCVFLTSSFIFAQNTYVPDDKFEQALIDLGYDTALDDSVLTANISGVTNLDVENKSINDLTGIEAFVALEDLRLWRNSLTSLDVSKNTALKSLRLGNNDLTSLDVSKNIALKSLSLDQNKLTSLDVSKNIALKSLSLAYNQLTSLDVSKNTALKEIWCNSNRLTSLDLSKNTALTWLICDRNWLSSLNVKNGATSQLYKFDARQNYNLTCIETLDSAYATTNWTDIDAYATFSLSCMEDFKWMSSASDTTNITKTNLTDTYLLQWGPGKDDQSVDYLIYAKIGLYPAEEIYDTTVTALSITYQEILDNVFEGSPVNEARVKFQVIAKDGAYSKNISGDDRVLYVNRYDYLSIESEGIPTEFALHENYPNPFNPTTQIRFDLAEMGNVTLAIYNMLGQKVKTFNMQSAQAGYHSLTWNATNDLGAPVSGGVYLYQLQTKGFIKTKKMVFLK
jgi:hypothetical protein